MSAQVVLKLKVDEFDNLREAVQLAARYADEKWQQLKKDKAKESQIVAWYSKANVYNRLLEKTLV